MLHCDNILFVHDFCVTQSPHLHQCQIVLVLHFDVISINALCHAPEFSLVLMSAN